MSSSSPSQNNVPLPDLDVNTLKKCLLDAALTWWPILRGNYKILIIIYLIGQLQSQYFLWVLATFPLNNMLQVVSTFGLTMTSTLVGIFMVMLVPLRTKEILEQTSTPQPFWPFFSKHIGPLTIEGLRMIGFVLLWLLLLAIPGIYKQVRWSFMPFVVMFEEDYAAGKIHPLKYSHTLTRGWICFFSLLGVTLVEFAFSTIVTNSVDTHDGPQRWSGFMLSSIVTMLFSIYTYSVLYHLYGERKKLLSKTL